MMGKINHLFLEGFIEISDFEFERLKYEPARKYYEFHITVVQKWSLKRSISHLFAHYKSLVARGAAVTYFGLSYGEVDKTGLDAGYFNDFVDLSRKTAAELINLAIVKLKMEEDLISFKINKAIVMMHDYDLITDEEYNLYIYGTTDQDKIDLTKIGLSLSLIYRLDADGQLDNIYIDQNNNLHAKSGLDAYKKTIDDLYRFEIDRFLN
jgi:hypothetical protein